MKLKEYNKILSENKTLLELKGICKLYKVKQSGKKEEIKNRLYESMKKTYNSTVIQRIWRKYMIQRAYRINNYNIDECINTSDFCTLDELHEIPRLHFFSYIDSDNRWFGFDIHSFMKLINKNKEEILNPYNREQIPIKEIDRANELSRLIHIIEKRKRKKKKKKKKTIMELFQLIDANGYQTDIDWFNELDKIRLIHLVKHLRDIWFYRLQLSDDMKKNICHPHGEPFINTRLRGIQFMNIMSIQEIVLQIIENMITKGINNEHNNLGINYVLCGFTLVSPRAAETLPWLYQAVI